jgi:putative DNA primase/helicase
MSDDDNVFRFPGAQTMPDTAEMHRGQLRFAERFVREYRGRFLHVHGIGWHQYDGVRWAPCLDGAETRAVTDLIKLALKDMPLLEKQPRDELHKDILKIESASGVNGVLTLAGSLDFCALAAIHLDADAYLLNTRSGTVNIRTGVASEPRPMDHLSKVTEASFDPNAQSDMFDQFLARIQPHPDMRTFLARSLGSSILGQVRDHVLHIWHGVGANGKGTLRDAVQEALGDYCIEVPADILLQSRSGQQALAPERMRLKGARLAFCSEIANGAKLDEATMKKLTGGDPVNGKLLYRNPVQFDPSHTLFMLTNHLPQVRGDDPATWRRILAVPFDVVVPADDRDLELPGKLKACADAVLAWLWEGWLDYQENGLNPPAAVIAATKQYQRDSDVLARFLDDESVIVQGHGSIASAELYKAFLDWCRSEGEEVHMSNKDFSKEMENRGFRKQKTNSSNRWMRISLASEGDEEPRRDPWF